MEKLLIPLFFLFHGILAQPPVAEVPVERPASVDSHSSGLYEGGQYGNNRRCHCTGRHQGEIYQHVSGQLPLAQMAAGSVRNRKCQINQEAQRCMSQARMMGCQMSQQTNGPLAAAGYICSEQGGRELQSIATTACATTTSAFVPLVQQMGQCMNRMEKGGGASLDIAGMCSTYRGLTSCVMESAVAACGEDFAQVFMKIFGSYMAGSMPIPLGMCSQVAPSNREARSDVDELERLSQRLSQLFA